MSLRVSMTIVVWLLAPSASAQSDAVSPTQFATPSAAEAVATEGVAESAEIEAPDASGPPEDTGAHAVPAPTAVSAEEVASPTPRWAFQIHGFVSEGGFLSTANEYIGTSSRGSLKFFEAGLNVSLEPIDQLRVGMQLVFRSIGSLSEDAPRVDWAVVDYRLESWLGMRAGIIKIPLGLYNEYVDIDATRTMILLPQSVYPMRNRDALISHTGFAVYGDVGIGGGGRLDYQAWFGTLTIPRSALELAGASLASVDTKYVTGGQVFWHPPLEGLRVGASYLRASVDFDLVLDADVLAQLVMANLLPPEHNGELVISQRPTSLWVASAEYIRGDWLFAAEYSRWLKRQQSSLAALIPTTEEDAERFYVMATYRLSSYFELGTYCAVTHADVSDRDGASSTLSHPFQAFQRDLAASLRIDVNAYWLWKIEAHLIDGVAELQASQNPNPKRYWGLFLFRTTVMF
jgi:hypothetical protein